MADKRKTAPVEEAAKQRLDRCKRTQIEATFECLENDDEANVISAFEEAQAEVMARG